MNQRRPRGPLKSELVQMGQLLTYKGDISVDSYLIDVLIERKTALFEALYRRNLKQVEWLLRVHHANPNQVCMTGQLLWNDDVMERFPIEHTLRGFMVTTAEDSALFSQMMELLMDYGSTDLTQTTSLMRILKDNVSLQLVCKTNINQFYPIEDLRPADIIQFAGLSGAAAFHAHVGSHLRSDTRCLHRSPPC